MYFCPRAPFCSPYSLCARSSCPFFPPFPLILPPPLPVLSPSCASRARFSSRSRDPPATQRQKPQPPKLQRLQLQRPKPQRLQPQRQKRLAASSHPKTQPQTHLPAMPRVPRPTLPFRRQGLSIQTKGVGRRVVVTSEGRNEKKEKRTCAGRQQRRERSASGGGCACGGASLLRGKRETPEREREEERGNRGDRNRVPFCRRHACTRPRDACGWQRSARRGAERATAGGSSGGQARRKKGGSGCAGRELEERVSGARVAVRGGENASGVRQEAEGKTGRKEKKKAHEIARR